MRLSERAPPDPRFTDVGDILTDRCLRARACRVPHPGSRRRRRGKRGLRRALATLTSAAHPYRGNLCGAPAGPRARPAGLRLPPSMPSSPPSDAGGNSSAGPWDPGAPPPSSLLDSAVKMALISAIMCTSLFGNVLVLLVFQRKPQLLHVANRFVLNLLLADLLQTVLVMPFAVAAAVPSVWPLDGRLCQVLVVLMHLFAFAGVNTIIVVSVDRYLAIIHPLSYPTRMTPHLGTNLIAGTWLVSVLQSTPPLYGWGAIGFDRRHGACAVLWSSSASYSALLSALSFWLPAAIMLACYWMVFRAARRQNALVHPIHSGHQQDPNATTATAVPCPAPQQPPPPPPRDGPVSAGNRPRAKHRGFQYHCKAARVVFIIMASYVLSMGPYSVVGTVAAHSHSARRSRDSRKETTSLSISSEKELTVHS
ncbi:hypothetical protein Z043_126164, partial [Scleropages formosus]